MNFHHRTQSYTHSFTCCSFFQHTAIEIYPGYTFGMLDDDDDDNDNYVDDADNGDGVDCAQAVC